jgi:hypothetical protein
MDAPIEVFLAEAPDAALAEKLQLFGQFVGSWELDVRWLIDEREPVRAEWHFAWALGGWAVQDVWIAPSRAERARGARAGEWGTTIRFYDAEIDAWRSTWLGPRNRVVMPFIGRPVGDEIVLEGSFEEGVLTRWVFHDIEPDSFRWKNVDSRDGGGNWIVNQEMDGRRSS